MSIKLNEIGVLLVEDDQNVRMSIKAMLQEIGITNIHEASDGQKALAKLDELSEREENGQDETISLIICDWNMPHKTGIEFLREVRQIHPEMPFLMVTARSDHESVTAAKENKVTGYIRKPFSFEDISKKVATILKIQKVDMVPANNPEEADDESAE